MSHYVPKSPGSQPEVPATQSQKNQVPKNLKEDLHFQSSSHDGPDGPEGKRNPKDGFGKRLSRFFVYSVSMGVLTSLCVGLYLYQKFSETVTKSVSLADYRPPGVTAVYLKENGKRVLLGEFFKQKRYLIPYDKIPALVTDAFISAEDDGFFDHQGISPMAILRAAYKNFMAGSVVEGGSTITQQVAKSLYLDPDRNIIRKIKEAILAARIERSLNKEQILYLYLNQIYLGNSAHGIQAAAKEYFRKDVSEMTLPEAALLAGLPKAPSRFNPLVNPKRAKSRQLYVLRRMRQNNVISEEQMLEAAAEPLKVFRHVDVEPKGDGSYALEHVRRYLREKYGEKVLLEDGLVVTLPGSLDVFRSARLALQSGLRDIDKRRGFRGPERRITEAEEIKKFLDETTERLVARKVDYQMLLPDGSLSLSQAMENEGYATFEELILPDMLYEALVIKVDDQAKKVSVLVGPLEATLPMKNMEWAHPLKEPIARNPEKPDYPSQVLKKGDVVWVRLEKVIVQKDDKKKPEADESSEGFQLEAHLEQHPLVQGGIFSMDVETGEVLAVEGGYRFGKDKKEYESEFNRAVQAKRQPGSAFKPIIYALGLEKGYTPTSIIVDSPLVYKDEEIGKWKPTNFSEKFYGDTTYRTALIKSRNIPTIKLVQDLKIPNVIDFARRMGFTGSFNNDLSISLGSTETTLMELTNVYSVFPRLGRRPKPVFVSQVVNRDGLVLEEFEKPKSNLLDVIRYSINPNSIVPVSGAEGVNVGEEAAEGEESEGEESEELAEQEAENQDENNQKKKVSIPEFPNENFPDQLLDPRVAFVMAHLMTEVVHYGTGRRAQELGRPAAGKTGTTNEYKDAWFMGFTPNIVTGVWVGFDVDGSLGPGETGTRAALPIWVDYMKTAVNKYPIREFGVPSGVSFAYIDPKSGKLTDQKPPKAIREAFIAGTEPTEKVRSDGKQAVDSESEFFKAEFE